MGAGKLIVGEPVKAATRAPELTGTLRILALFAFVFAGASLIDIGLALVPADLNAVDTRFVAFASMAGSLPLLAIGVLGLELASFSLSRTTLTLSVVLASLGALLCVIGLAIVAMSYGETLRTSQGDTRALVNMTALRSISSFVCFGLAFVYGAIAGWKRVLHRENS
jgi:hypothetical protein